jgi:hypothetical protein
MHRHHYGAAAPGPAAPERHALSPDERKPADEAGLRGNDNQTDNSLHSVAACAVPQEVAASKRVATAIARAALLGIEAQPVGAGAWLLRHACGGKIGIVHGIADLGAAIRGFEDARDDVAALVRRMRGAA